MSWLVLFAVGLVANSQSVLGIFNATSVVVTPEGQKIYPCLQVDHKILKFEPSILGSWHAIEIIHHRKDPKVIGAQVVDICPQLNIMSMPGKIIQINWQEKSGDINYSFHMVDPENVGFWLSWNKQTGSRAADQFEGSVQVLEAQWSRMVLRFCAHQRVDYSVVLVRNLTVPHDTQPVHNELAALGMHVYSSSLMCRVAQGNPNTAMLPLPTIFTVVLMVVTLLVSKVY